MRVLVVDDDDMMRDLLAGILTEAGYQPTTAENGEQALEMLRSGTYRLVVSDWVMPNMSGLQLCQEIRRRNYARYIYVIVVTSRNATEDVVAALDAGADDFIAKPVQPAELCVRLQAGQRLLALESRDVTILAMAKLAEFRDPETGAHLERIREYSRILAEDLSRQQEHQHIIDGEYIEAIYATSPLHDIGKVGVPDGILLKEGPLTKEEFDEIKKHTTIGAATLDAALAAHPEATFLQIARDIALCHHERWDGSGYPRGLSTTQIPLCARIVALADVYDALSSARSYKPAFEHQKVKKMIVAGSGKHFDPCVVDAFLRNESDFLDARDRFQDDLFAKDISIARAVDAAAHDHAALSSY